jgi:hypothetical protein
LLDQAQLDGAALNRVQLDGASLQAAHIHGTWLLRVSAWRANVQNSVGKAARIFEPEISPLSDPSFEELKALITKEVPEGPYRKAALARIMVLDPTKAWEGEDRMAKSWAALESAARRDAPAEDYDKGAAELWGRISCDVNGAPYVLRRLLRSLDPEAIQQSQLVLSLAAVLLDEEHCAGSQAFSAVDKMKLKAIRDAGGRIRGRAPDVRAEE